ncbi:MAG: hypothetical protein M3022_02965 [Actinomycetota bacterium]|nr:hypothetical protein [Actinomycetota bacterium]
MRALGSLLDADQHPVTVAPSQRPELAHPCHLGELAGALEVAAVAVDHVIPDPRVDLDHDAVGVLVAGPVQVDVLDRRLADRLDVVSPAAALQVGQPPLPLDQELGADQPRQRRAVIAVPRGLDLEEQALGGLPHVVRSELRVLVGGLGGGQFDPPLALGGRARAGRLGGRPFGTGLGHLGQDPGEEEEGERERDQHQRTEAVAEQRDVEEQIKDEVEREAAAVATARSAAAAEAGRSTTGAGQRNRSEHGRHDECRESGDEEQFGSSSHAETASLSGPAPGWR